MVVVFYEAKATRGFVKAVKAHDKSLDLSTFGKQFMYLLLSSVE